MYAVRIVSLVYTIHLLDINPHVCCVHRRLLVQSSVRVAVQEKRKCQTMRRVRVGKQKKCKMILFLNPKHLTTFISFLFFFFFDHSAAGKFTDERDLQSCKQCPKAYYTNDQVSNDGELRLSRCQGCPRGTWGGT